MLKRYIFIVPFMFLINGIADCANQTSFPTIYHNIHEEPKSIDSTRTGYPQTSWKNTRNYIEKPDYTKFSNKSKYSSSNNYYNINNSNNIEELRTQNTLLQMKLLEQAQKINNLEQKITSMMNNTAKNNVSDIETINEQNTRLKNQLDFISKQVTELKEKNDLFELYKYAMNEDNKLMCYNNKRLLNINHYLKRKLNFANSKNSSRANSTSHFHTNQFNNTRKYNNFNSKKPLWNNYGNKSLNRSYSNNNINYKYNNSNINYKYNNSNYNNYSNTEVTYNEWIDNQIEELKDIQNKNNGNNSNHNKLNNKTLERANSALNIINNRVSLNTDKSINNKNTIKTEEDSKKIFRENFEVNKIENNNEETNKDIPNNNDIILNKNSINIINNNDKADEKLIENLINSDEANNKIINNQEDEKVIDSNLNIDDEQNIINDNDENINNIQQMKYNLDNKNKGKKNNILRINDYNDGYSVITETNREDNRSTLEHGKKYFQNRNRRANKKFKNDSVQEILSGMKYLIEQQYITLSVGQMQDYDKVEQKHFEAIILGGKDCASYQKGKCFKEVRFLLMLHCYVAGVFIKTCLKNEKIKNEESDKILKVQLNAPKNFWTKNLEASEQFCGNLSSMLYNMWEKDKIFCTQFQNNSEIAKKVNNSITTINNVLADYFQYIPAIKNQLTNIIDNWLKSSQEKNAQDLLKSLYQNETISNIFSNNDSTNLDNRQVSELEYYIEKQAHNICSDNEEQIIEDMITIIAKTYDSIYQSNYNNSEIEVTCTL